MESKELIAVVVCVVVSLAAGFGVVRAIDGPRPLKNVFKSEGEIEVETKAFEKVLEQYSQKTSREIEVKEFEKALEEYSQKTGLQEAEAYRSVETKAIEYFRAEDLGNLDKIENLRNDPAFTGLKARAKKYLMEREKDNMVGMTEEEKSKYLKMKAREYIHTDVEKF